MRPSLVLSFSLVWLSFGLAGGQKAFCGEGDAFRPEKIRISRIDARRVPFEELVEQLQQTSGVKVEIDSELAGRTVYVRLNDVSLQSVLEVALPSQGATWEWRAESGLRFSALSRPWCGVADELKVATPAAADRRLNFRAGDLKIQDLADRLGQTYRVNLVCDHRMDPGPVRLELFQSSFAEGLAKLCAQGGWSWTGDNAIVVLLPSPENHLLRFPSPAWRNWVFDGLSSPEVARELARDFGVPIQLSVEAGKGTFTGQLRGKTLGEVVDDYCRQAGCAYAVFDHTLFIVRRSESFFQDGNVKPPRLAIEAELVNIPGDLWLRQRIQRIVTSALALSPEQMEEQVDQLRQIAGSTLLLKHVLVLEVGNPTEVRLEPATPQEGGSVLLSGRFRYLNRDYARVELSVSTDRVNEDSPVLNASMDAEALALKQPYLWCSELQYPDTERSSVVVFYLKFEPRLPPGGTEIVYRPMVWHTPRGTDRRRDLSNEAYYTGFPGPWSGHFLPHLSFGPSGVPGDAPNEDG